MDGSGRAYLADLRERNDSLLAHHTIIQGLAAVILGAGWWFKGLIELLQAAEGEFSGMVIFYIALPAIIIVSAWVNIFIWLLDRFRRAALRHVRQVFADHGLALMAMGSEFPEGVRALLDPPQRLKTGERAAETSDSFVRRVELIITRYTVIARGARAQPLPRGWLALDSALLPLVAVSGVLAFVLPLGPGQFLAAFAIALGLAGVKHTLYAAQLYAVRSVLVAALSDPGELLD